MADLFRERGERPALVDLRTGWSASYAELAELVLRAGALLRGHGLKPGDAVVQRLPNCPQALLLMLACMDQGLDCAPLSPHASGEEAGAWARLTGAKLSVISRLDADAAAEVLSAHAPTLRLDTAGAFESLPRLAQAAPAFSAGRLLIRTSGSSGEPKAVVQTAQALRACARALGARVSELDQTARLFAAAPMSTLSGLFNVGLLPLELGATVVIGGDLASGGGVKFWHDVARSQANAVWLPPSAMRIVAKARPAASLRCAVIGMAPCTAEEKAAFSALIGAPVYENYGLSETLFITATASDSAAEGVGAPLAGVELSLRAPEGPAAPILDDPAEDQKAPGEICVRSPFLFAGYLQPGGEVAPPRLEPDGFFRTGDLGRMGSDGGLILGGRLRAMIKRAGLPVFLPEIEALARQIAGVADAAAVPTTQDQPVERYTLLVRPASGADAGGLAQQVRLALAGRIARETWPDDIVVALEDFPLLAGGKLDYPALKAALTRLPRSA
jgi:long-chain acyl-CoA synthetase